MTPVVSAVIPTIGRPSLTRAVQSVLDQTTPLRYHLTLESSCCATLLAMAPPAADSFGSTLPVAR